MDLKFALATVKRDWPAECVDVRFTFERMDNSYATVTADAKALYKDWFSDCRMCPENGEYVHGVTIGTPDGKVYLVDNIELTFEELMEALKTFFFKGPSVADLSDDGVFRCCICGEELVCNDTGEMPSLCPNCGVMVEYPTPCIEMEGV